MAWLCGRYMFANNVLDRITTTNSHNNNDDDSIFNKYNLHSAISHKPHVICTYKIKMCSLHTHTHTHIKTWDRYNYYS